MKVLAVGDIHAKLWVIKSVERLIPEYDKVIFVGDYADDWNTGPLQTIETWRHLMNLEKLYPKKVMCLMGNHDYIYVKKTPTLQGGYNTITQTLLDAPENKDLKNWVLRLSITASVDWVNYSHAGFTEKWFGERTVEVLWSDVSPLWARPGGIDYAKNWNGEYSFQVFGHTPSETCWEVRPNVWCIDTFSTYPDGSPVGDETVLEIIDGKTFNKIKLKKETKNGNDSITGVEE